MNFKGLKNVIILMTLLFVAACKNADFNDGVRYQQEGEYEKAINCYNKSVKKEHNIAIAQKNLGDIYVIQNDYGKAFECYIAAIEANHNLVLGYVLKFISDSNKALRQTAITSLPKIKKPEAVEKLLDKLSEMLKSDKLHEKIDALDLIANMGCVSEPIFGDILNLLDDSNPVVKQKVLYAMPLLRSCVERLGALDKIKEIAQNDKNELVRIAAINSLGNLQYEARTALPVLFDLAEEDNAYSAIALKAIGNIGKTDRQHVKELKKYLYSDKNIIREKVLNILANMGQEANDMVPFIIPILKDRDADIRETARTTLRRIGTSSKEAVPDLISLLDNSEYEIRLMSLTELTDIGRDASDAVPAIKKLLKDSNENVRKYAQYALEQIGK